MNIKSLFLLTSLSVLTACGGGSGGTSTDGQGNSGGGSIDANSQEVAVASKETASQILMSESDISGIIPMDSLLDMDALEETATSPKSQPDSYGGSSKAYTVSESDSLEGDCGGSARWTSTATINDEYIFPAAYDFDYVFDDFCMGSDGFQVFFNGSVEAYIEMTDSYTGTSTYSYDVSYTTNIPLYGSGSMTYFEICHTVDGIKSCYPGVYDSETTTYTTSDIVVSGDSSSGFNVSYTMKDTEGQTFSIEFTGLTLCTNGNIGTGNGTVTYGSEIISIEFTNCDEFTISHDGNSSVYSQ